MATADLGLVIGSKWYVGDKITGTSTTPAVFDTDIEYALVQDLYLNTTTSNVYQCALEGDDTTAKWQYVCNIKGLQPPVVNSLNSTSTTDALSANMGNVLFEKLLNSGVFTQDIIVDISDTIYSVVLEVENKDSTITFTSEDDTATYSVTKSGTSETQTLNLTIESLFDESGVVIKEISSTENIYSVTLNGSGGTEVFSVTPSVWDKLNELDQQVKPGGNITDGEETLKEGVISRLINGVKTALYPITHAKAVWFDKSNNLTVNDKFTANDNNIASTENGATASQTLNAGSYILRNNQLYKVTTTIASGSAITEGVNIDSASVGDEITEINNNLARSRKDISNNLTHLSEAVAAQDLGKYGYSIGDYFVGNSGYIYILADYNTFKGTSTPYCITTNHIGIVVDTKATTKWHTGDASSVGYNGSTLHTYLKGTVLNNIKADFKILFGGSTGLEHLLPHSKLLTTALANWAWQTDQYISALSEVQIYGATVWGANGYQTGEAAKKLSLFDKYKWTEIFEGRYLWLRDLYSASCGCIAYSHGGAYYNSVTNDYYAVGLINFY